MNERIRELALQAGDDMELEIASLNAEIENLISRNYGLAMQNSLLRATVEAMKRTEAAENEALRRDAERYRWLRTNCYSDKYPYSEFDSAMQLSFTVSGIWANNRDPAVLDGCLDTAMGGET